MGGDFSELRKYFYFGVFPVPPYGPKDHFCQFWGLGSEYPDLHTVLLIIKTPPSIKATLAEIQKKVGIIKATRRDCARSARENFGPFWPILRGKRFKIGHFKAPKLTKILHFCQKKVVIIKATFGDLVKIPDFGP